MQQVVFAPSDPQRLYLSSDVGGCWRSDDGGATWHMLHGALPAEGSSYSIRGIVVDPRDADTVLIAADSGVWRSSDAGRSWQRSLAARWHGNGDYRGDGRILVIDHADPDTIFAAAIASGVHISHDGGKTWTPSGAEGLFPIDLHQDVGNPRRWWLAAGRAKTWIDGQERELPGGFFRSEDGGASWQKISDYPIGELIQRPADPTSLIARAMNDDDRVVRSLDGGQSWQRFDAGLHPFTGDVRRDGSYGALTTGPDFVLLGGNGGSFYRLDDGTDVWRKIEWKKEDIHEGDWWGALSRPTHWHFGSALCWMAVDPRDPEHWAFTDWYALYQSRSAGTSWELTIDGIEMTVVHTVVQDPANPQQVLTGVADVGYFRSADAGSTYEQNERGISNNVKHISICAGQPQRAYAVGPQRWEWHANQVFRSEDGGQTWMRPAMRGLGDMENKRCNTVVVHPVNPDECYLVLNGRIEPGGGGVWRSVDAGESWTWIGEGLPAMDHCFRSDIWVAGPEVAISSDGTLVAGSDDRGRLFRRGPGDAAWQEISFTGQAGGVNAVVADGHTAGRFWLCRKDGGAWRSDDGGVTWIRRSDQDAWSLAIDVADPQRVVFNGGAGIFLSRDGGDTWVVLAGQLPYRHLRNVVAFAGARIIVGTGGNGLFWSAVADAPPASSAQASGAAIEVALAAAGVAESLLVNGDMERGEATPSGWTMSGELPAGVRLSSDHSVAHGGDASLHLALDQDDAVFVQQRLVHAPDGRLALSAAVRVQGAVRVRLPVQIFDAGWAQIGWQEWGSVTAADDWQVLSGEVAIPPGAVHIMVGVLTEGRGQVWLDDISAEDPAGVVAQQDVPLMPVYISAGR